MTSLTPEQVARMRRATGIRLIKKMSTEELNETFTRQFDEIEQLRQRASQLEQERDGLFSLCLVVAAELHAVRCCLEHLDENTPDSINEKIRLQAIKLADKAKQLRKGVSGE